MSMRYAMIGAALHYDYTELLLVHGRPLSEAYEFAIAQQPESKDPVVIEQRRSSATMKAVKP